MWGEVLMNIKTVELGSENHILLTRNGKVVAVIDVKLEERFDYHTEKTYESFKLVGHGIEERHAMTSYFLGDFWSGGIEAIEEALIKS
jgi:hypothetical protein